MLSFLVIFSSVITLIFTDQPYAQTENGGVYGMEWTSFKGRKFHVFMSIPFAEKPVGQLRFEDPKEPQPWSKPLDGTVLTPPCIQNDKPGQITGQEDCLYLNVFTPVLDLRNITELLPVVVFIPGGAFYFFSSRTFGPRYLLDKDLVLVTFNYRLGIFGFLCTEDEVVPGNAGMKDQVMALGWVQRNIQYFGGDPMSVTLMGMSAGSASVHMHYYSILSRGLFHRGYMLGGTAFNVWAMQKEPLKKARASAEWLGCPANNTKQMVKCLKDKPAPLLAATVSLFKIRYGPLAPWGPVVDHWSKNPFLIEYPIRSLRRGWHYNVPLIVSDTPNAGIFPTAAFMDDASLADIDINWETVAPYMLDAAATVKKEKMNDVMSRIRKHYFSWRAVYANITNFIKMMSDRLYLGDMSKAVSLQAAVNPRVHYYMFNYRGRRATANDFIGEDNPFGAGHIDDFYYLMNRTSQEPTESSPSDVRMIGRMTDMLYRYAKTGESVFLPGSPWPPQRGPSRSFSYMRIDSPDTVEMISKENFADVRFWDSLPFHEPWAGRGQ